MTGREERDQANELYIQKSLKNAPIPLKDYIESLTEMTSMSRKTYMGYVRDFLTFINNELGIDINSYDSFNQIEKLDINKYINHTKINLRNGKENKPGIRNAKISAVISFFSFLYDNHKIKSNPCINIKKLKDNEHREVVYLTKDELVAIQKEILTTNRSNNKDDPWKYRDHLLFLLGCTTGMRQSAIREINVEDLDLEAQTVVVTEKNNVVKTMYLSDKICEAIEKWLLVRKQLLNGEECNALFISNRKKRIGTSALKDIIDKYTKDMGKHITPHKLRSTCAMNLYEATGDIYLVAQQLGHKNIQNTQIYAKATEKKMRETADLMDKIYG